MPNLTHLHLDMEHFPGRLALHDDESSHDADLQQQLCNDNDFVHCMVRVHHVFCVRTHFARVQLTPVVHSLTSLDIWNSRRLRVDGAHSLNTVVSHQLTSLSLYNCPDLYLATKAIGHFCNLRCAPCAHACVSCLTQTFGCITSVAHHRSISTTCHHTLYMGRFDAASPIAGHQ